VQIKPIAISSLTAVALSFAWVGVAYSTKDSALSIAINTAIYSGETESGASSKFRDVPRHLSRASSPVCDALSKYPKAEGEKLSFEAGEISGICKPFVKFQRHELDRCGDLEKDPYTLSSSSHATASSSTSAPSFSKFTWASRSEMSKRGKVNLFIDAEARDQREVLMKRIDELKGSARQLCCGDDLRCQSAFEKVDVSLCKPQDDPNAPDPCVFGGSYKMPG
jgi:hypothetical protein